MKRTSIRQRTAAVLATYVERLAAFSPNARLYLLNAILAGASMGVFRLLFNFFVLSLGYNQALLGNLITTNSLTALLVALPMGYLADTLGRKKSLLLGTCLVGVAVIVMVLAPSIGIFFGMNVIMGLAQSLTGVTMGPFLMENSSEKERVYLFSFSSGLMMASSFVGNAIGGYLPTWIGNWQGVLATSTGAYGWSLAIVGVVYLFSLFPFLFLRSNDHTRTQQSGFAPFSYFKAHPVLLGKLILPNLAIAIGAGLVIPFLNVFYRQVHHQPDPVIGSMFALGSLAMGIGMLIAPPLADRYGKIQLVVITQGLSIPFLVLLGFSPWFAASAGAYYIRNALMNMSGPVYQTFVMEQVDSSARATVASLVSMSNSFGWAFSPTISGWIQVNYGFGPAFSGTIFLYILSVFMCWNFFWKQKGIKKNDGDKNGNDH